MSKFKLNLSRIIAYFKKGAFNFEELPEELQLLVIEQMDFNELNALAMSNKKFQNIIINELDKNYKNLQSDLPIDENSFGLAAFHIASELTFANAANAKSYLANQISKLNAGKPATLKIKFQTLEKIQSIEFLNKINSIKPLKEMLEGLKISTSRNVSSYVSLFSEVLLNELGEEPNYIKIYSEYKTLVEKIEDDPVKCKSFLQQLKYLFNKALYLNDDTLLIYRIAKYLRTFEIIRDNKINNISEIFEVKFFDNKFIKTLIEISTESSEEFKAKLFKSILNKFPEYYKDCMLNAIYSGNLNLVYILIGEDKNFAFSKDEINNLLVDIIRRISKYNNNENQSENAADTPFLVQNSKIAFKCILNLPNFNPNIDIEFRDKSKVSLLKYCIMNGFIDEAIGLVDNTKCDITYKNENNEGLSPLFLALIKAEDSKLNIENYSRTLVNDVINKRKSLVILIDKMLNIGKLKNINITNVDSLGAKKEFFDLVNNSFLTTSMQNTLKERATLELYKKDLGKSIAMQI